MDVEAEIQDLRRRVGDLEGAMNVLSGRVGQVYPMVKGLNELAEKRFDAVESCLDRLVAKLDMLNTQVWSLRDDMPELMARAAAHAGSAVD